MTKENLEEMIKGYRWAGVTYPPKQTVTEKLIAKKAMEMADAHAKEIAIGFPKFIEKGYHPFMASGKYMKHASLEPDVPWPDLGTVKLFTTEQLYNLYLNSLNQK